MTIRRFSSRNDSLDQIWREHLKGALSYKRIAGYFASSLFEVADEFLDEIPEVQIVCNVDVNPEDLKILQLRETKLMGRWNEQTTNHEIAFRQERYHRLDRFLEKHHSSIRIVSSQICGLMHGKAGVITLANGSKMGFIGSMNETKEGWQKHYEILWEDDSLEGINWIEEEFAYLWKHSEVLPDRLGREIRRLSHRQEVTLEEIDEVDDLAPSTLIESPLYQSGQILQPWQKSFIIQCLQHAKQYPAVRLLLADEVGLGKTLSLGVAALILCLFNENQCAQQKKQNRRKPIAFFVPANLCEQWQTEMMDKLALPCARWSTRGKVWLDSEERPISPTGPEYIAKCPWRIGIISTGLLIQPTEEKKYLSSLRFELIVLDEAHKARTQRSFIGSKTPKPNEILKFMQEVARHSRHILLGTATPMQTQYEDLWDLLELLNCYNPPFVLGNTYSLWHKPKNVLPVVTGQHNPSDPYEAWDWLRSPLPPVNSTEEAHAKQLFSYIREDLQLPQGVHETSKVLADLRSETREHFQDTLNPRDNHTTLLQRENPLVRHIVLRKRKDLEEKGLLLKIAVVIHPCRQLVSNLNAFDRLFQDNILRTSTFFENAYRAASEIGALLVQQDKRYGLVKNLLRQRVSSSVWAGLQTAKHLLKQQTLDDEDNNEATLIDFAKCSVELKSSLEPLIKYLENIREDPKLNAILYYLNEEKWKERGVVIFSQYYDTAAWIAKQLTKCYPDEYIGLYAGANRSHLYQNQLTAVCSREKLKKMVYEHKLRIMVATDAAAEGLNLQTLSALINIDLPWNPTKLEQRIGRIKRIGQPKDTVEMLNLVNQSTVDEKIYQCLSERMKNKYDLFQSIPDVIEDDWIEDIKMLNQKLDQYIESRAKITGFDLRYKNIESINKHWGDCFKVLAPKDIQSTMSRGWER